MAPMTTARASKNVERTLGEHMSVGDMQGPSEEIATSQTAASLTFPLQQPMYSVHDAPIGLNLASQVPMLGMQVPPIGKFTGNMDVEIFDEWYEQFELIASVCGWNPRIKLANLVTRLQG